MAHVHSSKALSGWVFCVAGMLATIASAHEPLRVAPAGTRLRDVAIDGTNGTLFFAAYSRGELWKVDAPTGEVLARVQTGRGPASVALSPDGRHIACVNRLSSDAIVFEVAGMSAVGTFPCGEGASEVAALDNGVFAVVNSFSDSVTVIDVREGMTSLIEDVGRVPNGVAFSRGLLAVTTRLPAGVVFLNFSHGGVNPVRTHLDLPLAPVTIVAEPQGRFLIATESEVVRVDGETGRIADRADIVVQDLAACGSDLWGLTDGNLARIDASLRVVDKTPLGLEATRLECSAGLVVLVAPSDDAYMLYGEIDRGIAVPEREPGSFDSISPPASQAIPAQPPESPLPRLSEPASPVPFDNSEPLPEREPERAPPAIVEAEPVRQSRLVAPGAASASSGDDGAHDGNSYEERGGENPDTGKQQLGQQEANAPSQDPGYEPEAAPEEEPSSPPRSPYAERPRTLATFRTGAPEFAREAPHPAPVTDVWAGNLSQALAQGWDFGNLRGAFENQDWEQPLEFRGVRADHFRGTRGTGGRPQRLTFQGNVSWDWAESAFFAQRLDADVEKREITIEGARLEKELSTLDADRLYYRYPEEFDEMSLPLIEVEGLTEQERARRLYSMGYGEADNIALVEPFRELRAKHIEYDLAEHTGHATEVRGRLDILHFGVEHLEMRGPNKAYAQDAWVTPCSGDPPLFRLRLREMEIGEDDAIVGRKARLQIGKVMTPIYWPRWTFRPGMDTFIDIDFDSGRAARLGYYLNYGQRFALNRNVEAGFRFLPTEKEGVGFGIEGAYDFMTTPSSPLFRGEGNFRTLFTTEERGYAEAYHRHELSEDDILLFQTEYWGDRDIIKDFYYREYRHRTEPRTFANLTRTRPGYIATGTLRHNTHGFGAETERFPEVTYHFLDRQLARRLYVNFDTLAGYNRRKPSGIDSWRMVNVGRASLDFDVGDVLGIVPFYEADLSWYSKTIDDGSSDVRFSNIVGVTAQSRFHRAYPGALGFSGFKHVVVPSVTYSYRPEATMAVDETPRFDVYDNVYGRSRIESKIGNIVFGRDAVTGEVWQVARLTLYHGDDFWNEFRRSTDYEVELDLRPRPWWGILTVAERHSISNKISLDEPFILERLALQYWEEVTGRPLDPELSFQYNAMYGDYDRILSYLYYDDLAQGGRFGARLGFAYTETQNRVFNREILYGARYKLSEQWAFAFEHRFDLEDSKLYQQEYEVRKRFKCFDWSVKVRDRRQGWDFNFTLSLWAFPGTRVKF